jgi:hypothetical protein
MAMLVVLLEVDEGELTLGSRAADQLARLGVTSVALLGDERTVCVVVEGWAFDPVGSASQVASAISAATRSVRVLRPLMHAAVAGPPTAETYRSGSGGAQEGNHEAHAAKVHIR